LVLNEAKPCALLKAAEVSLASETDVVRLTGTPVGFAEPVGLNQLKVIADFTVTAINDGVTGALAKDLHYRNVVYGRDFQAWMAAGLRTVKAGIIWPLTPYHVIIVPIKYEGNVKAAVDRLAEELERQGIEVLLDDREERPGVKFNDADLIGIPYRVVIGGKNHAGESPKVEIKRRSEKESRRGIEGKDFSGAE
jgi:prolyl-tRNA synthetase